MECTEILMHFMANRTYSQKELDDLVLCPKDIKSSIRKKLKDRRADISFSLRSQDGEHSFRVFASRSIEVERNFSVGLTYLPPEGVDFNVIRCNGDHGSHTNHVIDARQFEGFHIHRAMAEAFVADEYAECWATPTTAYSEMAGAIRHPLTMAHVLDFERLFPAQCTFEQLWGYDDGLYQPASEAV